MWTPEVLAQDIAPNPVMPRLPVGDWLQTAVDWLQGNVGPLFDFIDAVVTWCVSSLTALLTTPPSLVVAIVLAALAFLAHGWRLALFSLIGFALVDAMSEFQAMMQTLGLVLVASVIAVVIAVPLGIVSARRPGVHRVVQPVLDLMQTMPAFVYLIPAVFFFSIGPVPGVVATVVFSLPPGVRLTQLGITQVDKEMVEAGEAFGSPPRRILTEIQIPLAMPSIMAGINQVIMLSLSMVVIAGMVGAKGLGSEVFEAVQRIQLAHGFEAGISVVILAIFLDRVTSGLGSRSAVGRAERLAGV